MVSRSSVSSQLKRLGQKFRFFGRSEAKELKNIINPDESILQCAYGHYHGGSGLLVATDKRIVLVDKRPFYLNVESMSYDNLTHVDYRQDKLHGVLYLQSGIKRVIFRSMSDARLKFIRNKADEFKDVLSRNIFSSVDEQKDVKHGYRRSYLSTALRPYHKRFYSTNNRIYNQETENKTQTYLSK
jgi:hypothetical protein